MVVNMIKRFLTWSFFIGALLGAPLTLAEQSSSVTNPIVVLRTNSGDISLELYADKSPITVANFLSYVDSGHYDNTIFHRVISNFMIQGGGYTPDLVEKPTLDPIVNESRNRLHNLRGTIAMARTSDPDSASSQFFINHRNNLRLDWAPGRDGYTVFGEVIDGMSTVDFIATVPTRPRGMHANLPVDKVIVIKAERVTQP
jgi:cyclophilin family peptidyl-prolyl cis-trans isomerase